VSPWWNTRTKDVSIFRLLSRVLSGWVLTLNTRTRNGILSCLLGRNGYWPWALRLGMLFLLDRDGYWYCDPWFFVLFRIVMDIGKFYKLWPKIYYRWLLGRDGYYHVPRIMTRASFLSFLRLRWALPCIWNIVLLCVIDILARLCVFLLFCLF
jgi:hypothetical protein